MKTSELIDEALNWAVAKAEGPESYASAYLVDDALVYLDEASEPTWEPSLNWAQGGPIIEREEIGFAKYGPNSSWKAVIGETPRGVPHYGHTPLVAAMRAYVASKLGDDIEIPEELK